MNLQTRVKLNDGNTMPILGFGVYELMGEEASKCVKYALQCGYRHIDSAEWYENEAECGRAIREFLGENPQVSRSEIFYTTKLKYNNGRGNAKAAVRASLKECGLDYIDLYLIHGPIGGPQMRKESWEACVEAQREGLVKSIGVSNFGVGHLNEMLRYDLRLPSVNQVDLHPFQTRLDIVEMCKKHNIVLQAWAPIVRGMRFDHPVVNRISVKHSKFPAQVLLRYSLQKGYVPLPKSAKAERIRSNADVFDFEISAVDMKELDGLDEQLVTDWEVTKEP